MSKTNIKESTEKPDCFVVMPIADSEGYDKGHFRKVYEDIHKVACERAGFNPIRADEVQQTNLIHLDILQKLVSSPMAVCDLSNRNPNVLFELGLRQAFDKPTVIVQEVGTPKIFDISPLRYTEYRKELKYREVLEDQEMIADAIRATKIATDKGEGVNSIISLLSLSSPASLKDISGEDSTKILQVIMAEISELRTEFNRSRTMQNVEKQMNKNNLVPNSDATHLRKKNLYDLYDKMILMINEKAPIGDVRRIFDEFIELQFFLMNDPKTPFHLKNTYILLRGKAENNFVNYINSNSI